MPSNPTPWSLRLLGALALTRGGRAHAHFRQQRTGLLLALLARVPGRAQPRELLLERLWPEVEPSVGRRRLSVLLAELRGLLEEDAEKGSVVQSDNARIWLVQGAVQSDLQAFESALDAARDATTAGAKVEALQAAMSAYGGAFLPGLDFAWVDDERRALADRHQAAVQQLSLALERAGRPAEALAALLQAPSDPSEEAHGRALRLFLAAGRPEAGLEHHRAWEREQQARVGRRPSAPLVRLAADLERAAAARPLAPAPEAPPPADAGLVTWLAARAPGAGSADDASLACFAQVDDALEAARPLRAVPGARLALEIAASASGGARAAALLRVTPRDGFLVGAAAAALLHQRAAPRPGLVALGRYEIPRLGPEVLHAFADATGAAPVPRAPRSPPALQAETAPLYGRSAPLAALSRAATPGALLTVTGIPGIGKTALARAWLAAPDGAADRCFIDLGLAADRDGVLLALSAALGLEAVAGDPLAAITRRLQASPAIWVVLDQAEQAIPAIRSALAPLRAACPQVTWCCTSPVALDLPGEVVVALDGLELPHGALSIEGLREVPALALLLARARLHEPAFALTSSNARALTQLARALEGVPLALELAAAGLQGSDPQPLLRRLEPRLPEGQAARPRPGPAQERTLQVALDAAWALLSPGERLALAQLSVFRGGCSAQDAEAVLDLRAIPGAPFPMDALDALVQRGLARALPRDPEGAPQRYSLPVPVRTYAADKLTQFNTKHNPTDPSGTEATADRHARWYARLGADEAVAALDGPACVAAWARLRAERDNLTVALARACEAGLAATAGGAARALLLLAERAGGGEDAARWARATLALPDLAPDLRRALASALAEREALGPGGPDAWEAIERICAEIPEGAPLSSLDQQVLLRGARACARRGRPADGARLALRALQSASSPCDQARAEATLGDLYGLLGDATRAIQHNARALDLARAHRLLGLEAQALAQLLDQHLQARALDLARPLAEALLAAAQPLGGARLAAALTAAARLAEASGDPTEAEALRESAALAARRVGLAPAAD